MFEVCQCQFWEFYFDQTFQNSYQFTFSLHPNETKLTICKSNSMSSPFYSHNLKALLFIFMTLIICFGITWISSLFLTAVFQFGLKLWPFKTILENLEIVGWCFFNLLVWLRDQLVGSVLIGLTVKVF